MWILVKRLLRIWAIIRLSHLKEMMGSASLIFDAAQVGAL